MTPFIPIAAVLEQKQTEELTKKLELAPTHGSTGEEVPPGSMEVYGDVDELCVPSESATVLQMGQEVTESDTLRDSVAQAAADIDLEPLGAQWTDTRHSRLVLAYAKLCARAPSLISEQLTEGELKVQDMLAALPLGQGR